VYFASARPPSCVYRALLAALFISGALAVLYVGRGEAQVVTDPDYWKQTPERRATVYRFFYGQSPQAIPSGYDPVAEAEQILRQRQAAVAPSTPGAPSLWQQIRGVTFRAALSAPLRAITPISLAWGPLSLAGRSAKESTRSS
jgi:hypothetical protein